MILTLQIVAYLTLHTANFGSIKKVNDLYQEPSNYDDSEHKLDDISGCVILQLFETIAQSHTQ